jgi:hypothetical protein
MRKRLKLFIGGPGFATAVSAGPASAPVCPIWPAFGTPAAGFEVMVDPGQNREKRPDFQQNNQTAPAR